LIPSVAGGTFGTMKPRIALACLVVLVTVATGCGGSGEDVASTAPSSDGSQTGDAGSAGGSGLPDSAADDIPVDVPDGWEIDLLGEIGMTDTTGVQLLYPADDFDRVVGFYDDWTESQDEEYIRTEDGDLVVYTATGSVASIAVTRGHEERDQPWTLVQVTTTGG
jgi:hypothetical protein